MKIIYRYILLEMIMPMLFGIAAFTSIFIGTNLLFEMIDYYNRFGVGLLTLGQLFFLNLPGIIVLTFPMATLLGVIMAYGRLSSDSEITALRAGGVSIYRLIIPALLLGLLISGLTIVVNELVVPDANYRAAGIVYQFRYERKMPLTQRHLFLTPFKGGKPDYVLYTELFDGDTGKMQNVVFQDYEDGRPSMLIQAEEAVWSQDSWQFYRGQIFTLKAGERMPAWEFDEYRTAINYSPVQISKMQKKINDMDILELREFIQLKQGQGNNVNRELVKYHQRLSIPFASLIFALLAAPLAIQPQRSGGSATGLGLSIIIIFIYYSLMTVGAALGEQGSISPFCGAWLQNLVFLVFGSYMLYKMGN